PQPLDRLAGCRNCTNFVVTRGMLEDQNVLRNRRAGEAYVLRRLRQRSLERSDRGAVERSIAPLEDLDRLEGVARQRLRQLGLERRASAGGAERTIAGGAAGAASDLRELGRIELAKLIAIEFAIRGERDVIHVEVEPHADRIGRDEIFNIA